MKSENDNKVFVYPHRLFKFIVFFLCMNYFRINTLVKSSKQNYEGFMLGIAFIVKSFLNKIGSDKIDTGVLFVIP